MTMELRVTRISGNDSSKAIFTDGKLAWGDTILCINPSDSAIEIVGLYAKHYAPTIITEDSDGFLELKLKDGTFKKLPGKIRCINHRSGECILTLDNVNNIEVVGSLSERQRQARIDATVAELQKAYPSL